MLAARRPEQRAAADRVEAARRARTAATLGWAPDVTGSLTGLVTQNAGFSSDDTFVIASVQAEWGWDGGAKSSRVREASAAAAQARAAADAVDRQVEEEVRVAWAGLERARAAAVAAGREREAAAARLAEAELAFGQGAIPFVELSRAALGRSAAALAERVEAWNVAVASVELAEWAR